MPSALANIKTGDLPAGFAPTGTGVAQAQARKSSPTLSHSNAFSAYRKESSNSSSAMLSPSSPFGFHDLEDDSVPCDTPALVADDGHDLSGLTSLMWKSIDFNQFNLFPDISAATSALTSTIPPVIVTKSDPAPSIPVTVSPQELSLPLPFNGNNVAASEPFSFTSASFPASVPPAPAPSPVSPPPPATVLNQNKKRPASPPLVAPTMSEELSEDGQGPAPKKRRQQSVSLTGTRSASTSFVPLDAPTQTRTYVGPPSKTTKRVIPAAAARKVAAIVTQHQEYSSSTSADEHSVEQLQQEVMKTIEEKRRQNTVAARRSRMRKAEHLQNLEDLVSSLRARVEELENEKDIWMRRALDQGWKA